MENNKYYFGVHKMVDECCSNIRNKMVDIAVMINQNVRRRRDIIKMGTKEVIRKMEISRKIQIFHNLP